MEPTHKQNFPGPHPTTTIAIAHTALEFNKTVQHQLNCPTTASLLQHNKLKAKQATENKNGLIQTASLDSSVQVASLHTKGQAL